MKPLGLGEHGGTSITREGNSYVAYVRYRDYSGRGRRIKRRGRSKADASRNVLEAVREALGANGDGELTKTSTLDEAATSWLLMFEGLVERGVRSPTTLQEYRHVMHRVVSPMIGSLRVGEISTPRLDRFLQAVLVEKGYATAKLTRSVLSGICSWLVRRGALMTNPVRDVTPLELDRDRIARALSVDELRVWLELVDGSPFARRHDLPELARFMLATGLRLGEALGMTWADVDLTEGAVAVRRTIVRITGKGLVAKKVKSRASERVLLLPSWCVQLLRARRVRLRRLRWAGLSRLQGWLARPEQRRQGIPHGAGRVGVRLDQDPHLPQDSRHSARRQRGKCPDDRRPVGPLASVHDAGLVPRSSCRQRRQP